MANDADIFSQINNAVLDLQAAHLQSYQRPLKTLARLLRHPDLEETNTILTDGVDLQAFLAESEKTQRSMAGSARLTWPDDHEKTLGLTMLLIEKFAADPDYVLDFGHTFFYSGSSLAATLHAVTRNVIIPFARDYKVFASHAGRAERQAEIFTLRPGIWGMSIDLKAVARHARAWWRGHRGEVG